MLNARQTAAALSGDGWWRGWGSNPDEPEARGILRRRGRGNEISNLLTRCPFPFPRVTGSDRILRGLWTPRWTPVSHPVMYSTRCSSMAGKAGR